MFESKAFEFFVYSGSIDTGAVDTGVPTTRSCPDDQNTSDDCYQSLFDSNIRELLNYAQLGDPLCDFALSAGQATAVWKSKGSIVASVAVGCLICYQSRGT